MLALGGALKSLPQAVSLASTQSANLALQRNASVKQEVRRRRDSKSPAIDAAAVSQGLPADLADKAGQRLALISFAYAASYALLYASSRLLEDFPRQLGGLAWLNLDTVAVVFIGISLLVFALAMSGRVNPYRLIELGLVYEVVGALGIEMDLLWWPTFGLWPTDGTFAVNGISWTCPWIVVFTLIVPATPGKVALAALVSASVRPLMLLVLAAQGIPFAAAGVDAAVLVDLILPNYVCAAMAIFAARIVWGYGRRISEARRMGSYRLVEKLGEGGMGEVWKAEHQMLARPAAIKLIRSEAGASGPVHAPASAVQRFEREVQSTAELRSPHTVVVYDFGFTEDRTFYYVMELLEGISLQQAVEKYGPMPTARVVHILRQVCHSLAEAHAHGMVHRDIKPANIFICRHGREHDFVKVLDFGLVKHVGHESQAGMELTEVGTFAGTPAYGSPEAAAAEGDAVDARSDIYSLGCVAFWLLTGRTVFDAPSPVMMLVQHVKEEPAPPSQYTELEVPPALDELVLECLRKNKAERPSTADELESKLGRIDLTEPWSLEQARSWWDLHCPRTAGADDLAGEEGHRSILKKGA
jgi:serine/threonine-protein kinase